MKLVVGLGNPGRKYTETRHNVGFMTAAKLGRVLSAGPVRTQFEGDTVDGTVDTEKVLVLCPATYMNHSGRSVRKAVEFYKLTPDDVLVVCDDLNLPLGRLRIRAGGSAGGQKGLADVIRHLGTDQVPRLRIGIDPPPEGWAVPDYVLSKFGSGEQPEIERVTERAALAAADWVQHGVAFCMNRYNGS